METIPNYYAKKSDVETNVEVSTGALWRNRFPRVTFRAPVETCMEVYRGNLSAKGNRGNLFDFLLEPPETCQNARNLQTYATICTRAANSQTSLARRVNFARVRRQQSTRAQPTPQTSLARRVNFAHAHTARTRILRARAYCARAARCARDMTCLCAGALLAAHARALHTARQ